MSVWCVVLLYSSALRADMGGRREGRLSVTARGARVVATGPPHMPFQEHKTSTSNRNQRDLGR
ncbi:Uncharacterised protein [Mycobacterium tuberculosis]|nr:Uncharacterised protein [Mycobacterium tuberculosis]